MIYFTVESLSKDIRSLLHCAQGVKSTQPGHVAFVAVPNVSAPYARILARRSAFFAAKLNGSWRDNAEAEVHMHVQCPSHLWAFLVLFYTDMCACPSSWSVLDVIDTMQLCKMVGAPEVFFCVLGQKLVDYCTPRSASTASDTLGITNFVAVDASR